MEFFKYLIITISIPLCLYSIPGIRPQKLPIRSTELPLTENATVYPRPHANCYWVEPGRILAGEYPMIANQSLYTIFVNKEATKKRLNAYLDAGITFFLDLTQEGELYPYLSYLQEEASKRNLSVSYQRMPIRDMSTPTQAHMAAILETIDKALTANHRVYIHCLGGIGRTGTVVGCYLVHRGKTGPEALDQIASWWQGVAKSKFYPRSPQTQQQVEFVKNYTVRALRR